MRLATRPLLTSQRRRCWAVRVSAMRWIDWSPARSGQSRALAPRRSRGRQDGAAGAHVGKRPCTDVDQARGLGRCGLSASSRRSSAARRSSVPTGSAAASSNSACRPANGSSISDSTPAARAIDSRKRCGSGIRWCARRRTERRACRIAGTSIARWPTRPIRSSIPTGGHGIAPTLPRVSTRPWPTSWSARPAAPRIAAASPRRPSSSERQS